MFAINLETFANTVSLTATVPGYEEAAIHRSASIPADAIYSWSTGNFEAGSSFAAPQLAAISALLWQACLDKQCAEPNDYPATISQALKHTTRERCDGQDEFGLGLIHANKAWRYLKRL